MPSRKIDTLITNVNLATFDPNIHLAYGHIEHGAIALHENEIVWVGHEGKQPHTAKPSTVIDGLGQWLLPGFIDCHTHLIYGGNRAREFESRLLGESYESISKRGGGIAGTVQATRKSSESSLLNSALLRLDALLSEGVTTVEIKSGYGLNLETEILMLRVAGELSKQRAVNIQRTFLGAHALPPEYANNHEGYIDAITEVFLPLIRTEQLADAVDVFCEGIGFSNLQCRRVFTKAKALGLPIKGHVEQLSDLKGARLVAEFHGLSVDHIEYLAEEDIPALKRAEVVAVLLPGAFYYLQETRKPPISALRNAGVPMAVATDLNPGTSPMASLLLAINQSCVLFGLSPEEALTATTRHAAQALGLQNHKGQLKVGFDADLALWDINHPSELCYSLGMNKPRCVWHAGKVRTMSNV